MQTEDITTEVACVVEIRGNGEIGVDKCEKIMNEIEIKIFKLKFILNLIFL